MGQAVLYLGRYRERLLEHFDQRLNPNRSLKALLMLIALYHDIAKPVTREIESNGKIRNLGHEKLGAEAAVRRAQALQLSNLESDRLRDIIRYHMRIHSLVQTHKPPTPKAIYRFFRDAGDSGVDLCLLALADTLATYETTLPEDTWTAYLEICRLLLESYWENPTRVVDPPGLVNGHDLQTELKISPGPRLGLLLEAIREAQAEGQIHNRDEALRFGREWIKQERKPGNGNQDRSNQPLL
jgi:putative nucleotidyltransferase with HDIG domain